MYFHVIYVCYRGFSSDTPLINKFYDVQGALSYINMNISQNALSLINY